MTTVIPWLIITIIIIITGLTIWRSSKHADIDGFGLLTESAKIINDEKTQRHNRM